MLGREVVIVEAVRTPVGRGHREKGAFRDVHPNALLGATYLELIRRAGIDAAQVDDVLAGCVQQYGEQSFNIGRNAWLQAGLPYETPATTIDRQCGSAQQAVNFGASLIASRHQRARDRLGRRAHGPDPDVRRAQVRRRGRHAVHAELYERYDLVDQGLSAELIAERVGPLARAPGRDRARARSSAPRAHAPRAASSARSSRSSVNGDAVTTDQGIRPDTTRRDARRAEAGVQGGRHDHGGQLVADLRRRRRGAARLARDGRRARPARRARGSSTSRRSASTR